MTEKNLNNVDQIRDLIFGNQIKDFEEKFTQLNNTLQITETKITKLLNESHSKLKKETDRSLEMLEKKIDNVSSTSNKGRINLKELIGTIDESLQGMFVDQKDEFDTKIKTIKENLSDDNQKMSNELNALNVEIKNILKEGLATLEESKLSRDSMAQMFLNVAMKIQGTDVSGILVEEKKAEK